MSCECDAVSRTALNLPPTFVMFCTTLKILGSRGRGRGVRGKGRGRIFTGRAAAMAGARAGALAATAATLQAQGASSFST